MKKFVKFAVVAALLGASSSPAFAGGTYKFTVNCNNQSGVAQWNTGDIDPGYEWLKVATGTNNPGCSIGDFSEGRDSWMPVTVYQGPAGVVQGIPLIGTVLEEVFGF